MSKTCRDLRAFYWGKFSWTEMIRVKNDILQLWPWLRLMRREELAISLQPLSELLINFKIISVQYLLTIVANILNIFTR